jgi:hypothetical protein
MTLLPVGITMKMITAIIIKVMMMIVMMILKIKLKKSQVKRKMRPVSAVVVNLTILILEKNVAVSSPA